MQDDDETVVREMCAALGALNVACPRKRETLATLCPTLASSLSVLRVVDPNAYCVYLGKLRTPPAPQRKNLLMHFLLGYHACSSQEEAPAAHLALTVISSSLKILASRKIHWPLLGNLEIRE